MTDLKKKVARRSDSMVRDGSKRRRIVVTLFPNGTIGLRPEGTRRLELVPIDAVWAQAVKARVNAEKAEKAKAKKIKRTT